MSRSAPRPRARAAAIPLLVLATWLAAPAAAQRGEGVGRDRPYDAVVERDVMVPMRDGVTLSTDLYFPARDGRRAEGRFPAIVHRAGYGKGGASLRAGAEEMAGRGYVVVYQDVRGRFLSGGDFYPYLNEAADGHDLVEWVVRQPWSNGRVGAFGSSYTAGTAHGLAATRPTGLQALFINVGGSNYFEDAAYLGGAPQVLHNFGWSVGHATDDLPDDHPMTRRAATALGEGEYRDWLRAHPRAHLLPLAAAPEFAAFYRDWLEHGTFDDYWRQTGYDLEASYDSFPDIPVLYLGGWYDLFLRGTLRNYAGLSRSGRRDVRLLIGPWTHPGGTTSPFPDQVDFGPGSERPDDRELQMAWFDRWLKDDPSGTAPQPKVRIFVMGGGGGERTADGRILHGGRWRDEPGWPVPGMTPTPYYLHAGGRLSIEPPAPAAPTSYEFDPADPVPTLGGNMTHGRDVAPMGAADQRCRPEYPHCRDALPLAARPDVLVFETEPLAEPLEVTGPITVRLCVSSSAPDTDFTAKLVDVYPPSEDFPDGFALNLADGVMRARFREGMDREALLEPGQVYELEIDLWGTSNLFDRGHRIRIDVSSSNFPRVDVNPNTGERTNFHTREVKAYNSVYHDPEHSSHVVLPVVRR